MVWGRHPRVLLSFNPLNLYLMAKVFGGFTANFYGKIGNVIGRVRQGRTILSAYQPNVANPRTANQLFARRKFALLTQFFSSISSVLKITFRDLDGYKTGNPFSAAIGYNFKRTPSVFTGNTADTVALVFDYIRVSQGAVNVPWTPQVSVDGTNISVTWSDNSGIGNADASDLISIVAYNPAKNDGFVATDIANRSERSGEVSLPSLWSMDLVHVWLYAKRSTSFECSDSVYLGAVNL